MRIPLISHSSAGAPFSWKRGKVITAAQYIYDVQKFAAFLRQKQALSKQVLNICQDRYHFVVGLGAAMLCGQQTLMPSTYTSELLKKLSLLYPHLYVMTEDEKLTNGMSCVNVQETLGSFSWGLETSSIFDIPTFPKERVATIVFTSGSTGEPVGHEKTWGKLVINARNAIERFSIDAQTQIVATVPSQHMYGFESVILLALQSGALFHADKPFYPLDIVEALSISPMTSILVTTPYHLKNVIESDIDCPKIRGVLSATAALPLDLAHASENTFQTQLLEIYGCTETGQLATRHTLSTNRWTVFQGVVLNTENLQISSTKNMQDEVWAQGAHIEGKHKLQDRIELHSETQFTLLGRNTDMVNVAGKRSSLAYLTTQLLKVDGVYDGAYYLPLAASEQHEFVERLVAFVVLDTAIQSQLKKQDESNVSAQILRALREKVESVFLPKKIFIVSRLPRNSLGKLPLDLMHAMYQQQLERESLLEFMVSLEHPCLPGHFPLNPILPGVLSLEQVMSRVHRHLLLEQCILLKLLNVKFLEPALPNEKFEIHYSYKEMRENDVSDARAKLQISAQAFKASNQSQLRSASAFLKADWILAVTPALLQGDGV